jgi:tRNA threonylcarbamoyladenosine biosynthesis protein TsaB
LRALRRGRFVTRMPSLRQLAAAHAPLLFLDAASSRVQVGLWERDGAGPWQTSSEEAGIGVFRCVEQLGVRIEDVGAFVYSDGPGSILGVRTVAMALRTWNLLKPRPLFAYSSLALVGHALGRPDVGVIADARRDSWHHYQLGRGLRRLPTADLAGELVMPENFRHWSPLPAGVTSASYAVPELLARVGDAEIFDAAPAPDAFLHEEPSYVTWTPQIHRAPAAGAP